MRYSLNANIYHDAKEQLIHVRSAMETYDRFADQHHQPRIGSRAYCRLLAIEASLEKNFDRVSKSVPRSNPVRNEASSR